MNVRALVALALGAGPICGLRAPPPSGDALAMPPCDKQPHQQDFGEPLSGYMVEFPQSPNVARLNCQLGASFQPLVLEEAVKSTQEDWDRWQERGLIAQDHILGGWDRDPIKYASIFMNHLHIWRDIASAPEEKWAGVFEGDTIFRGDFHEILRDLRQKLAAGTLPQADIVYLGHCLNNDCGRASAVATLSGNVSVINSERPVCSHAYLLSRRGARLLRDNALPIRENNDEVPMRSLILEGKLKALSLCPTVARQADKDWVPTSPWLAEMVRPYTAPAHLTMGLLRALPSLKMLASTSVLLSAVVFAAHRHLAVKRSA